MAEVVIPNWPDPRIVIQLKSCSCGSDNVDAEGGGYVWIECDDCGECGMESKSMRGAAEYWNTRRHDTPARNRKKNERAKRVRCRTR